MRRLSAVERLNIPLLVAVGLHCSCSRWSTENELLHDKRLTKYLNNIEGQYLAVLDQVTENGGTETLHKTLAKLKPLVDLAQQQKELQQVYICRSLIDRNKSTISTAQYNYNGVLFIVYILWTRPDWNKIWTGPDLLSVYPSPISYG